MKVRQYVQWVCATLICGMFTLSCQSPLETPPTTFRSVTIHVQNAAGVGMENLPVSMYALPESDTSVAPVSSGLTDRVGRVEFSVEIPAIGKGFRILAGDDRSGRVSVEANLLCRDTVLIIKLQFEDLPCGGDLSHTLRIADICAPLKTGERFSDSAEIHFASNCDDPLTFTFSGDSPDASMKLRLLDDAGKEMPGFPFTIPARGRFTLRAVATPQDSGLKRWNMLLSGNGPNQASSTIRLTVEVDAANCNICDCPDTVIVVDFGLVQAAPTQQRGTQSVRLPANLCNMLRVDNLIKGASHPTIFGVSPIDNVQLLPGRSSSLQLSFVPGDTIVYRDTVLVEHFIPAEQKRCTTKVILVGQGCGPVWRIIPDNLQWINDDDYILSMGRVRVYESSTGMVCFENYGLCGSVTINLNTQGAPGFTPAPQSITLQSGEQDCFRIQFEATDNVVWPQGHGNPAKTSHNLPLEFTGPGGSKTVDVQVLVDTLPAQFSRCIYQWDQNGQYGFNFTPVEGKGEDKYDPMPQTQQLSDILVEAVSPSSNADVRIKGGWKLIKNGVSEAQFNFSDMSSALNGWTRSEYLNITTGTFNTNNATTLYLRSVYSIRIERNNGEYSYACVRVREVSIDADNKYKMCLDVLYPMIKE